VTGSYNIRLWRDSLVKIGDGTTCNGVRIVCDNSRVIIGKDCLLSNEIIIQSADQHGVVDLKSGKIINSAQTNVHIGNHVWIGHRASILHGADIGSGSIVGFGTLANKKTPENSLIAGVPGKIKKNDISWSRSPSRLDSYTQKLISEYLD
jgi:acetyltransferase-like isoleucine patch superfamily enzyme